jgi:hypothetical protein
MLRPPYRCLSFALLVAAGACSVGSERDRVALDGVPQGEEWGLLIDGTTASGPVDDRVATGTAAVLALENFWSHPGANDEVIAFVRGGALDLVENAPWTPAEGDVAEVEFAPEIDLPLTIWIVKGPWSEGHGHALGQLLFLGSILQQERVGIRLAAPELIDATANANAGFYHQFTCADRQALQQTIGSRPGRINVYRVETVRGTPFAAEACDFGSGFVALGRSTGDDALVHEIGHSFGLEHPVGILGVGDENVMAELSTAREYLTEGQTFRAHVDPASVINSLYGARAGEPRRGCPHAAASASCPPLATRIWPDAKAPAGPAPQAASTSPEELVESWLQRDCELGGAEARQSLREHGDRVAELSLAAFRSGPAEALRASAARAARARFALRRHALGDLHLWGIRQEDVVRVVNVSEADYVARELDRFALRYRTQALRGLLEVRPDLAGPLLGQARSADSPLREIVPRLEESHSPD